MSLKLKPLDQQVIFISGASSGIGLATVHRAVEQGAKVFMVSRNQDELIRIHNDLKHKGYDTAYSVADVANLKQIEGAVELCFKNFGTIDTFINNAGISIYSRLMDTKTDEARRLFDTNFWGVVNGCRVAVEAMKEKGGAIINIGSVLSNVALPIQGLYSASKHAVKAYTDVLRRELLAEKLPIQVTLIMPSAIDTPYAQHARSHIGTPILNPPVYAADVVAKAILRCAHRPTRELGVGLSSYLFPIMDKVFPALGDKIMARNFMEQNQTKKDSPLNKEYALAGNLFLASEDEGQERGDYPGHILKSSLTTQLVERKNWFKGGAILGGFTYLFLRRFRSF